MAHSVCGMDYFCRGEFINRFPREMHVIETRDARD